MKEMWAVLKGLQSLPESVSDCRIDAQVDSMVVFHAWSGCGPRSRELMQISQLIFRFQVDRNLSLNMFLFFTLKSSGLVSRRLSRSDAMLSSNRGKLCSAILGALTIMILT